MMVLKGKKLHPNSIQGIRGFAMAYKGLATFTHLFYFLFVKIFIFVLLTKHFLFYACTFCF
jgi:hypothetical protein